MAGLNLWTNGCDMVIAASADEAKQVVLDLSGPMDEETLNGDGWAVCPDDDPFTLREDTDEEPWFRDRTMSVREWVAEHGPGYFASTEY